MADVEKGYSVKSDQPRTVILPQAQFFRFVGLFGYLVNVDKVWHLSLLIDKFADFLINGGILGG